MNKETTTEICKDCNQENPEPFVIDVDIWLDVAKTEELLCLDCFEKRLGRACVKDDFYLTAPCNMFNDRVWTICGFKPLTEEEKDEFDLNLKKKLTEEKANIINTQNFELEEIR
jgi:hypothetical protein